MNIRRKKKLKKKIRKVTKISLFLTFVLLIPALCASGYFYFFESNIKGNYYFSKAQDLDDASPYGSREAIKYYKLAIESYEAAGNRGSAVNAYIDLGLLHYKFGNIMQVERMVLSAIKIGGDDIPKPLKAKSYMLLASTAEPSSAKDYINKAIDISGELNQKIMSIKSYFILAKIYEYQADFEDAKKTYLKAIKVVESLEAKDGFYDPEQLYSNLGELYAGEGATLSAINYYEKALDISKNNSAHGMEVANYLSILGDLYKDRMQMAKACENWNGSRAEYTLLGKQPPMSVLQLSMSDSCQKLG